MNQTDKRKRLIYISVVLCAILILLFLPIRLPHAIKVPGKIVPSNEWIVTKGKDGRLMTSLINNEKGIHQNYTLTQFERGDAVKFNLHHNISSGTYVNAQDTIAYIYSNEIEKELTYLESELENELASLNMYKSGEKESIINEAKQKIEYAQKTVDEQEKLFNRQKYLYEKRLISEEDYDIALGKIELYKITVEIAEEQLKTVQSGVKEEQINFINSKINSLQTQINVLKKRLANYNLISPISGFVSSFSAQDTILVINDTTGHVIFMPIRLEERSFISLHQNVVLKAVKSIELNAKIISIGNNTEYLNGNPVFLATAFLETGNENLLPGLIIECNIVCEKVTIKEYLIRFFNSLFI